MRRIAHGDEVVKQRVKPCVQLPETARGEKLTRRVESLRIAVNQLQLGRWHRLRVRRFHPGGEGVKRQLW
eukprot:5488576-Pleurochrysis_carterae.AAC.1